MFKSIEYKLVLYTLLLIVSVVFATYFILNKEYIFGAVAIFVSLFSVSKLYSHYRKFNQNILFLLNALDNGDYSFHFTEAKLSKREKELNHMLNRIKDILSKARKNIIENEKFLSVIIESVSTGIVILDHHNNVQSVNRATLQLLGMNVFTHINQLKGIDESFPELFQNLKPNTPQQIKVCNEREESQISLRASTITLKQGEMKIITLNNIGNELEAKEMESWVRLIRVMTHEIMNSIAPITSLSETLLFSYRNNSEEVPTPLYRNTIDALEVINSTAKGLITFVESYRKFTGIPKPEMADIELLPLLDKIIHLESQHLKDKNIEVKVIQSTPSVMLNADLSQITQVLVNLVKNAIEAIDNDQTGKIQIKVSTTDNRVQVDICNNGTPIPPDIAAHIFIPFFTTKDTGSGIGLSVSRYIMRLHGGNLKHHTSEGWTVFSMIF